MPKTFSLASLTGELLSNFEWWWSEYPRKVGKLDAMRAWKQTSDVHPEIEKMIAILDKQANSNDWHKDGGAFIPYPASYLRAGRFLDEL